MASEMRNRTEIWHAGIRPDSRCVAAADMLTALSAHLAERDRRIAALTEALRDLRGNIGCAALVKNPVGIRVRAQADAALTTDKEPTT